MINVLDLVRSTRQTPSGARKRTLDERVQQEFGLERELGAENRPRRDGGQESGLSQSRRENSGDRPVRRDVGDQARRHREKCPARREDERGGRTSPSRLSRLNTARDLTDILSIESMWVLSEKVCAYYLRKYVGII